ncbi:hypothetical protein CEXT_485641 [Caerostris extrusa]|uniref:Uncharacterized protein n=1 Tax=Caerostris extrusa TaxID=172846 RepID=A0AAV4VZN6_CAEEX|nr:hypothetical protein CEXT_485641 [Caerostris extrusa]
MRHYRSAEKYLYSKCGTESDCQISLHTSLFSHHTVDVFIDGRAISVGYNNIPTTPDPEFQPFRSSLSLSLQLTLRCSNDDRILLAIPSFPRASVCLKISHFSISRKGEKIKTESSQTQSNLH